MLRFDLLCGFNKQEGATFALLPITFLNLTQESVLNGMSKEYARVTLTSICEKATPLSVDLCVNSLMSTYGLDTITDDKERGIQLSYVYGMYI